MTERWGDRYIGEEVGLIASQLGLLIETMQRIADALERFSPSVAQREDATYKRDLAILQSREAEAEFYRTRGK